jgi:hypothetical protein
MHRLALTVIFYSISITLCVAADFRRYENDRFSYTIDVPSDFKTVLNPDNGDGIGLHSADDSAQLLIWGNNLTQGGFLVESDLRRGYAIDAGFRFTYERRGATWASLSGRKGEKIIYMRQILLCDAAMGNFTLEYPAAQQKRFEPVIDRMVKTLKPHKPCA